ncbi:transcriptional regulator, IclR family [Pseudoxanthobacter soli DSM 19599]|uniref:Transcriptional regulator, IclR family n=1 Tax=Pseudoxanthobacter soli DSM 19599 TaxID=1123029 RepID=A0A1M7ZF13_9HYPH|nr:IclR family transcriptional regulator [Pseudoxanthobacter soli]SHO63399.1 transcriptional regulator, IclR family [Pseudoxanthobacter soli DSM 19599]
MTEIETPSRGGTSGDQTSGDRGASGDSAAARPAQVDSAPADSAPALRRAVRILDLVTAAPAPPTAAEIARALGLPRSTAHGLIGAMVDLGLLARTTEATLRLGPHLMNWASGFLAQFDLVGEFRRLFEGRPGFEAYTITLSVREGSEVIYLACCNSAAPLGFTFRIGMRLPAAFAATGKAMLSTLAPGELSDLFAGSWPAPLTPRSVGSLKALESELAAARARGYSVDDGQIREGMVCLGAPVADFSGKAIAGVAVSLLEREATPGRLAEVGAQVRAIADDLSGRLGGPGNRA